MNLIAGVDFRFHNKFRKNPELFELRKGVISKNLGSFTEMSDRKFGVQDFKKGAGFGVMK